MEGLQADAIEPSSPTAPRWINAELEDHAPHESLAAGKWYTLVFDVDVAKHATAVGAAQLMEAQLFPEGTDEVQLTVQLDSADFEISDQKRPLRIPRAGRSREGMFFYIAAT